MTSPALSSPPNHSVPDIRSDSRCLVWSIGLLAVFAPLMWLFPQVDIEISRFFFDPKIAPDGNFWLRESPELEFLFDLVDWLSRGALIIAVMWMIWEWAIRRSARAVATIIAASLALGPGVVTNELFKEHWGRSRPRNVTLFAGEKQFSPAFVFSSECPRNCSFPSGHAAAGFAPVVGHFVSRRRVWLFGGIACGVLVGGTRVAVGAHFFSDSVFAFFVVFITAGMVSILVKTISDKQERFLGK